MDAEQMGWTPRLGTVTPEAMPAMAQGFFAGLPGEGRGAVYMIG